MIVETTRGLNRQFRSNRAFPAIRQAGETAARGWRSRKPFSKPYRRYCPTNIHPRLPGFLRLGSEMLADEPTLQLIDPNETADDHIVGAIVTRFRSNLCHGSDIASGRSH